MRFGFWMCFRLAECGQIVIWSFFEIWLSPDVKKWKFGGEGILPLSGWRSILVLDFSWLVLLLNAEVNKLHLLSAKVYFICLNCSFLTILWLLRIAHQVHVSYALDCTKQWTEGNKIINYKRDEIIYKKLFVLHTGMVHIYRFLNA